MKRSLRRITEPQFPQYLFSIDEAASLDVALRSDQSLVQGCAVGGIEPVTGIEGEQIDFCPLGKLRRLVDHESTIVNACLESHVMRISQCRCGTTATPEQAK